MLKLNVPDTEYFDEKNNEFVSVKGQTLMLEHSLISLAKWESKWKTPFLSNDDKTYAQMLDYIRCMTTNNVVDDRIYMALSNEHILAVKDYINDAMTATWFNDKSQNGTKSFGKKVITAEILYYDMIALQIPFECQKWHLNRLITLIRVCEIKNSPPKKMGKNELMRRNRALNAARKARFNTSG